MLKVCTAFVLMLAAAPLLVGCNGSGNTGVGGVGMDAAALGPVGTVRVIDADTFDVGGERVRLFGIDAPEQDQTCRKSDGQVWDCGKWAADQARLRYGGQRARCTRVDTDRYGRTVARCVVNGGDVGREMVRDGLAFAYARYSKDYVADERRAAASRMGLHASQMQSPAAFRAAKRTASVEPPRSGNCQIKGNISRSGERIYHMPGQQHYSKTRISGSRGERWFCSEDAARAAGWRRAFS